MRFTSETEIHERIGVRKGVLPVITYSLPENPSRGKRAWLAMPVADHIEQALGGADLRQVARSIGTIARTLSGLHDEDIYHRDIKPANLFHLNGEWCIGDFGLVSFPEKDALTRTGDYVGSKHYLPREVIEGGNPDSGPVDVYELSKTLWVLATGRQHPIEGYQPSSIPGVTIASALQIKDETVSHLDLLIERCTHPDPSKRPSMSEVADELEALVSEQPSDLSTPLNAAVVGGTKARSEAWMRDHSLYRERDEYAVSTLAALQPRLDAIGREVERITGQPLQSGAISVLNEWDVVGELHNHPENVRSHQAVAMVQMPAFEGRESVHLILGIALCILRDDTVLMVGGILLQVGRGPIEVIWQDGPNTALRGSVKAKEGLDQLLRGIRTNLNAGLVALNRAIDRQGGS